MDSKHIEMFEENLRELAYDSYCILGETEPNTRERAQWMYIDYVLESLVEKFFGGYNTPDSD